MRMMLAVVAVLWMVGPSQAEDAPSYSRVVAPILHKYCLLCHGDRKPKSGFSVTSYGRLFRTLRGKVTLVKSAPEKSLLVTTMDGTKGRKMPPKKHKVQPTRADIDLIRLWIKAGAKND